MKCPKKTKIILASLAFYLTSSAFAASQGLMSIGTSISSNADNQLIMDINLPLPFVVSVWSMLSSYYSQNSTFPPAGLYAVSNNILTGVGSITNSGLGTLEICYGPGAPGPLANNCYALAPTRITLRGNTFYVYELAQCFTNITDSLTSQQAPTPGTPIALFGNSNLGTPCLYAADPQAAAIAEVQGTNVAPPSQNGVSP